MASRHPHRHSPRRHHSERIGYLRARTRRRVARCWTAGLALRQRHVQANLSAGPGLEALVLHGKRQGRHAPARRTDVDADRGWLSPWRKPEFDVTLPARAVPAPQLAKVPTGNRSSARHAHKQRTILGCEAVPTGSHRQTRTQPDPGMHDGSRFVHHDRCVSGCCPGHRTNAHERMRAALRHNVNVCRAVEPGPARHPARPCIARVWPVPIIESRYELVLGGGSIGGRQQAIGCKRSPKLTSKPGRARVRAKRPLRCARTAGKALLELLQQRRLGSQRAGPSGAKPRKHAGKLARQLRQGNTGKPIADHRSLKAQVPQSHQQGAPQGRAVDLGELHKVQQAHACLRE